MYGGPPQITHDTTNIPVGRATLPQDPKNIQNAMQQHIAGLNETLTVVSNICDCCLVFIDKQHGDEKVRELLDENSYTWWSLRKKGIEQKNKEQEEKEKILKRKQELLNKMSDEDKKILGLL